MAFASGSITFKRFVVLGEAVPRVDEQLLDQLTARSMGRDTLQTADRTEVGWITGEHILDTDFSFARNAIGDGLSFALRIDVNKPPTDLVRSYQRQNEQTMLQASGREFLSKAERREAREQALARADAEARTGQFRRMKQVPVFWDLKRGEVYLAATGPSIVDSFMLLFRQTFDRTLVPVSAGELAVRWATTAGEVKAFDDARPALFVQPPEGVDTDENPGRFGDQRSRDFLGTEWLLWLWYITQVDSAEIGTQLGESITVLFEKSLQMDCAFGITGKLTLQADDPSRQPEAAVALAGGKRPIKAGLQVAARGELFSLNLRGDVMHYSGVVLPPPEDVANPRVVFEDRIEKLRDLIEAIDSLYVAFVRKRLSSKWTQTLNAMRSWAAAGRLSRPSDAPAIAS